jgi:prepilin-type N-terminal cleavage/methylation domain-containing protein
VNGQRGLTLVELLVAMAITSMIFVAIADVTQVGEQVEATWSNAITNAQSANRLAGWLQRDTHRYTPCSAGTYQLDLCLVRTTVVTYQWSAGNIVRVDNSTDASAVVARGVAVPGFTYQVSCGPAVATGTITVSSPQLQIPFRTSVGAC